MTQNEKLCNAGHNVLPKQTEVEATERTKPSMSTLRIRPAIVLFGDSITQQGFGMDGAVGWASMLSSAYTRRADVLNRGFSGYNTRHCLEILPRVFSPSEFLFCTVLIGANDASLPGERQHVPIQEYEENLGKIVALIREKTKSQQSDFPIILMTPPPLDEPAWTAHCPEPNKRSNEAHKQYGESVKKVGTELSCPVFDVFEALGGNGNDYGQNLSDGLHLNGRGNTLLFEGLLEMIKIEYPHLAPMEDGDEKYGTTGIPMEEKLWRELC
jgi:lysophospholipase L1-like esterase